jgi:hypothetical protein
MEESSNIVGLDSVVCLDGLRAHMYSLRITQAELRADIRNGTFKHETWTLTSGPSSTKREH